MATYVTCFLAVEWREVVDQVELKSGKIPRSSTANKEPCELRKYLMQNHSAGKDAGYFFLAFKRQIILFHFLLHCILVNTKSNRFVCFFFLQGVVFVVKRTTVKVASTKV